MNNLLFLQNPSINATVMSVSKLAISCDIIAPGSLPIYCCIDFFNTRNLSSNFTVKQMFAFCGVKYSTNSASCIARANEAFDTLYNNGIILEPVKIQRITDVITTFNSPEIFTKQASEKKIYFRTFYFEEYWAIINYKAGRGRSVSHGNLLRHYMYLRHCIHQNSIWKKRAYNAKNPDYAYISMEAVAAALGSSVEQTSACCHALKDLGLIYFDNPMSIVDCGIFKNQNTIFVATHCPADPEYCWQMEYVKGYYKTLEILEAELQKRGGQTDMTYIVAKLPKEIADFLEARKQAGHT